MDSVKNLRPEWYWVFQVIVVLSTGGHQTFLMLEARFHFLVSVEWYVKSREHCL